MALTDPILPLYAASFGISHLMIGFVVSSFGLTRLFLEAPGGLLTDRIGRKPMMLYGYTMIIVSFLLAGFARSVLELIVSRMIIGCGSALFFNAGLIYVGELASTGNRFRFIALFQSAWWGGGILGPTMGGLIMEKTNIRTNFFFSAGLVIIGVFFIIRIKESRKASKLHVSTQGYTKDVLEIIRNRYLFTLCMSCLVLFLTFNSIQGTMIPIYGVEHLKISPVQIGFIFSLTSTIIFSTLMCISRLESYLKRSSLLFIGMLISSASIYSLSLASDFITLSILSIPFGIGLGLTQPIPFAMLIDFAKPEKRGVTMGIFRTAGALGIIIGPTMVGFLIDLGTVLIPFYIVAATLGTFSLLIRIVFGKN
jgi:MFS family permease